MKDKKIIGLVSKDDKIEEENRKHLLDAVDKFRLLVEKGEIKQFIITSLDEYDDVVVTSCTKGYLDAMGLYEIGKYTLMLQKSIEQWD